MRRPRNYGHRRTCRPGTSNPRVTVANTESIDSEAGQRFEHVSDAELLASTRRLVGRSNQLLAALLARLAEVEARGIHRLRACSSLYTYCLYELRLSEDAAFRRARAARVARTFPVIFQQVADGELHLTAIVMLAPHLTEENHLELLALAKHRTKREILRIVRTFAPEPTVPDRVELLGPQPVGIPIPSAPSWRSFVESFASGGRQLAPGDSPKDRVDHASAGPKLERDIPPVVDTAPANPVGETTPPSERYRIQFTASQEYVGLLERAQDLLSHAVPDRSLEECTCERFACWSISSRNASMAHLVRRLLRRVRRHPAPPLSDSKRRAARSMLALRASADRPRYGAKFATAMERNVHSSTSSGSAVARPDFSSCITSLRTRLAAAKPRETSRYAAKPTTRSPRSTTSGARVHEGVWLQVRCPGADFRALAAVETIWTSR